MEANWTEPTDFSRLTHDEVHVWRADVRLDNETVSSLERLLSNTERDRAEKFRFSSDRSRFIARRGILRGLLGRYLDRDPESLRLETNDCGKPCLSPDVAVPNVRFNLSHSEGEVVFAFALRTEIGIDVEWIRDVPECLEIADRFFTREEATSLRSLSGGDRAEAFLESWTSWEALAKAQGVGLSGSFDRLATATSTAPVPWSLVRFRPRPGFTAALVGKGAGWEVRYWQVPAAVLKWRRTLILRDAQ